MWLIIPGDSTSILQPLDVSINKLILDRSDVSLMVAQSDIIMDVPKIQTPSS